MRTFQCSWPFAIKRAKIPPVNLGSVWMLDRCLLCLMESYFFGISNSAYSIEMFEDRKALVPWLYENFNFGVNSSKKMWVCKYYIILYKSFFTIKTIGCALGLRWRTTKSNGKFFQICISALLFQHGYKAKHDGTWWSCNQCTLLNSRLPVCAFCKAASAVTEYTNWSSYVKLIPVCITISNEKIAGKI